MKNLFVYLVKHALQCLGHHSQPFCSISAIILSAVAMTFLTNDSRQKLQTQGDLWFQRHNSRPSLNAILWIGSRIRFGAQSNTSTFRPCMARDTRADNYAAMSAGLATASISSSNKSTSPPRASSSSLEPNTRTEHRSPANSLASWRIATACA